MIDEVHFEVEEGERHPSDHSWQQAHRIESLLQLLVQSSAQQTHLLRQILEREPLPTYYPTIGGTISVTE